LLAFVGDLGVILVASGVIYNVPREFGDSVDDNVTPNWLLRRLGTLPPMQSGKVARHWPQKRDQAAFFLGGFIWAPLDTIWARVGSVTALFGAIFVFLDFGAAPWTLLSFLGKDQKKVSPIMKKGTRRGSISRTL